MDLKWKDPNDRRRLQELIGGEANAKQRDRYRVTLIAGEGLGSAPELEREQIAAAVGRSRNFVDRWVGRYRRGGIDSLRPKRQKGASAKLTVEQQRELCAMLDAGPAAEEGIAAYNGPIIRQKIEERFNQVYSLKGVYHLLHRLGYNDLMPRTKHPDTDPAEIEAFKKKLPETLAEIQAAHPDKRVLRYYQDEARFGQHGTITRVWARVGTRPGAIRQTQYDYLYVFSAVCPETGDAAGLITPHVNTDTMNAFLAEFSKGLPQDVHAAMVLDQAGWHMAKGLKIPSNVTLVHLPPKSPELNPAENLWHYLRSHYWSNRLYETWEELKAAATDAWRRVCLVPELIKTVCADTAVRAKARLRDDYDYLDELENAKARCRHDASSLVYLAAYRKSIAGQQRVAVILSSSTHLRNIHDLFHEELGHMPPCIDPQRLMFALSLSPGAQFTMASLQSALFGSAFQDQVRQHEDLAKQVFNQFASNADDGLHTPALAEKVDEQLMK